MSYVICADIHAHAWSAFSKTDPDGVNSRLNLILRELRRAGELALQKASSRTMIIAGDLFHTRGNVAPSVLNPVFDLVAELTKSGVRVIIMAGNHDLEGKNSTRLSSAVTSLEGAGAIVVNDVLIDTNTETVIVPWVDNVGELKEKLQALQLPAGGCADYDLILHAPINGVILGIPDHGLDPAWLASLGWKRVLSGHYHQYKSFEDGKVISIGAIGHHTWNDVDTTAGFILVEDKSFVQHESSMPKFVDLVQGIDLQKAVPGNYVRAKVTSAKMDDINQMREGLEKLGAAGVTVITVKPPTEQRPGTPVTTGQSVTLQQSITDFVRGRSYEHADEVATEALKCLAEASVE